MTTTVGVYFEAHLRDDRKDISLERITSVTGLVPTEEPDGSLLLKKAVFQEITLQCTWTPLEDMTRFQSALRDAGLKDFHIDLSLWVNGGLAPGYRQSTCH